MLTTRTPSPVYTPVLTEYSLSTHQVGGDEANLVPARCLEALFAATPRRLVAAGQLGTPFAPRPPPTRSAGYHPHLAWLLVEDAGLPLALLRMHPLLGWG